MKHKIGNHCLIIIFIVSLFGGTTVKAQDNLKDRELLLQAKANTAAYYFDSFGEQLPVYNGKSYYDYNFNFETGSPYFFSDKPEFGSVTYNGIRYDSMLMQYNQITDVLVIFSPTGKIQLDNLRVSQFILYNAVFSPFKKDSSLSFKGNDYYNILYSGKMTLLGRQQKQIQERFISNTEIKKEVETRNYYWVIKGGAWHAIHSKKDFFKLLDGNQNEVKKFARANKLNFRKKKAVMLTKSLAYAESLK